MKYDVITASHVTLYDAKIKLASAVNAACALGFSPLGSPTLDSYLNDDGTRTFNMLQGVAKPTEDDYAKAMKMAMDAQIALTNGE